MRESAAPTAKIGVFGGTFDPPHYGHLAVAAAAMERCGLDRVLFVVANQPWQKLRAGQTVSAAADRLAMVEAAIAGREGFEACRLEIDRGGESYMADTLTELSQQWPGAELALLVGSDTASEIVTWKRVDVVGELARLVVVERPGFADYRLPDGWDSEFLRAELVDISSTQLRAELGDAEEKTGAWVRDDGGNGSAAAAVFLPAGVAQVIAERGLYSGSYRVK